MTLDREVQLKVFCNDDDSPTFYWNWDHVTRKEFEMVKKAVEQITGRKGKRYD